MKNLLAACVISLFAPVAFAQTCAQPAGPVSGADALPRTVTGTTCGADTTSFGTSYCTGGVVTPGAPASVVQLTLGAENHFTATVSTTTASFNPALFLVGPGTCGSAAGCPDLNDAGGPGANESLPSSGTETAQQPAGTYYLVISSTTSAADCGEYSLSVTETLPVALKSFSID